MLIVSVLTQTGEESNDFSGEQCNLNEAAGRVGKAVISGVDLGHALGRDEDDAKGESGPEREEEDDGLGAEEECRSSCGFI